MCKGEKGRGCEKSAVGYSIRCLTCASSNKESRYDGETSRNAYHRGKQHLAQYKNKSSDSVLWKHCVSVHQGSPAEFEMSVGRSFRGDPMMRQIDEGTRIQQNNPDTSMNSKREFHQPGIVVCSFERLGHNQSSRSPKPKTLIGSDNNTSVISSFNNNRNKKGAASGMKRSQVF